MSNIKATVNIKGKTTAMVKYCNIMEIENKLTIDDSRATIDEADVIVLITSGFISLLI